MYCLSNYIEIRISSKYFYAVVISPSVTTRGACPPVGREESEDSQQQSNDFYMLLHLKAQINEQ